MKRLSSTLRFALPLALLIGMTAATMVTTPASADNWKVTGWLMIFETGETGYYYYNETKNMTYVFWYNEDGSYNTYMPYKGKVSPDPSPDDPKSGGTGISPTNVAALIKAGLITYKIRANPESTPLAQWIDREGGGMIPHYNPGDQDTSSSRGNPPKKNNVGLTAKQKAEIVKLVNFAARTLGDIGGSMGGYGDASESAPTFNKSGSSGRSKGTSDGSGNSRDNRHKGAGEGEAATLGPRPDLVNPEPKNKTGASVLGGGLLDGGGGVSSSGPAAIGSPLGTGGGGNSSATSSGGARAGGAGIR